MSNTTEVNDSGIYRQSFAAAMGAALGAGAIIAIIDILVTGSRGSGGASLWALTFGLQAIPFVVIGVFAGAIAGGFRANFGRGALGRAVKRLVEDRKLDMRVTGALLAAAVLIAVFVFLCANLSMSLVGKVERKSTGALLLGIVLVCSVLGLALIGLPVYRGTRKIAPLVPRIGPLPAALALCVLGAIGALALGLFIVFTRLEWRSMALDTYGLMLAYPVLMLVWLVIWYRVLDRVRQRIPQRGVLIAAATAVALVLPAITLRGTPDMGAVATIVDNGMLSRISLNVSRSLMDGDGDGFSAFLGGPDCDDDNADVHPEAKEIPGNGLDDNCMGGDRALVAKTPVPPTPNGNPDAPAGTPNSATGTDGDPCAKPDQPAAAAAKNLLLIMVDTVRADRLGVAGYKRDDKSLTPRLDAFVGQSGYFSRAYAQAPNTPRSMPSMFTSRFPSQVAVHKKFHNFPKVLDDNLTIFEVLQQAGVHTVAYASHFYFEPRRNMQQGFDIWDNEGALNIAGSNKDTASPRIVPKVEAKLAELGQDKRRFAMFVHLFEPHSTYMKHDGYTYTERGTASLMQKYDYEIAYVDQWIGRIFDSLDKNGLADDTMVVVLSDHGEAFGVHRMAGKKMFFHGQTLYDELLRVPLIMRVPGVAPSASDDVVMLVDVAPTIAEAMGMKTPETFLGRSLLGRMRGQPLEPKYAYGELLPAPSWNHSARILVAPGGKHKLYARTSDSRFEVYDLAADPDELNNLARDNPELLKQLKDQLLQVVEVDLQ